jgi:hypothetical protein
MKKSARKLHLGRETIANLSRHHLQRAAGGNVPADPPCSECCSDDKCITTVGTAYMCPTLVWTCRC